MALTLPPQAGTLAGAGILGERYSRNTLPSPVLDGRTLGHRQGESEPHSCSHSGLNPRRQQDLDTSYPSAWHPSLGAGAPARSFSASRMCPRQSPLMVSQSPEPQTLEEPALREWTTRSFTSGAESADSWAVEDSAGRGDMWGNHVDERLISASIQRRTREFYTSPSGSQPGRRLSEALKPGGGGGGV